MLVLPIVTITLIAIVSVVILIVIIYAIARCTCCKKGSGNKKKAKHEELDRFLGPEESEDEYMSGVISEKVPQKEILDTYNKAFEEEPSFHYVEQKVPVVSTEADTVSVGVDEVVHTERAHVDLSAENSVSSLAVTTSVEPVITSPLVATSVPVETVKTTVQNNIPVAAVVALPPVESKSNALMPVEATPVVPLAVESPSPESPAVEISHVESPTLLAVPSPVGGSRDDLDLSVQSDDHGSISTNSTLNRRKKLSLGKLSRSTQRINSMFSENAKIKISLQYIGSVKCLKGNIASIEGLDFQADHCPQEISFHLRFFPNKKFHMATKHKPIFEDTDVSTLNLTFTMGPVYTEDLSNNTLRVKLYGKKTQRLTRSKCYGECSLHLEDIVGKTEPIEFIENIAQKPSGSWTYSSDSDGVQ